MNHLTSTNHVVVSRPKVTLIMVLCGIVSATAAGAVSAAATDDDVPSLTVRYNPESLSTERGARVLYRRLVNAAEAVCPASSASRAFVSDVVQHCRDAAVARAVHKINSPRLAEVYAGSVKRG
ncbi:MAG TPA: UrcA family protein [Steroidobacteraceae bacterium]|jgi:UrcA family protein|nr:UrcA family protein [Steroidobacteraceae bacterium]